jgi:hypothetical protein
MCGLLFSITDKKNPPDLPGAMIAVGIGYIVKA